MTSSNTLTIEPLKLANLITNAFNSQLSFSQKNGYDEYIETSAANNMQNLGILLYELMTCKFDTVMLIIDAYGNMQFAFARTSKGCQYVNFTNDQANALLNNACN